MESERKPQPPADTAALAQAIDSLLNDRERARVLGSRARTRAHEHYGVQRMMTSYERIYSRLVPTEQDARAMASSPRQ